MANHIGLWVFIRTNIQQKKLIDAGKGNLTFSIVYYISGFQILSNRGNPEMRPV